MLNPRIATVVADAAMRRGLPTLTLRGQAPYYLQGAPNPAVSQALLTAVARLLDLELDVSPFEAAVRAFRGFAQHVFMSDRT